MERVSLVTCASTSDDTTVVRRTEEAVRSLGDYGAGLRNARKIAVKINAGIRRVLLTDGKQTELTDPAVVEGVIRAIRDVTDAEIVIGDAPTEAVGELRTAVGGIHPLYEELGYPERLKPYANVRLIDFGEDNLVPVEMRHEGCMFSRYWLHRDLAEADAFVSIAKMKAHVSLGVTLCIKNLFGWTPPAVYGAPRHYLHDRLIRLPRVLADLANHFRPCLNVVDGIVALNNSEWHGTALRPGVIVAGTNIVATDTVATRVMGVNADDDYPSHPFFYRRNAIKLAAGQGVGPNRMEEVEVVGVQPGEVVVPFTVHKHDADSDRPGQLRRGATAVERYLSEHDTLVGRYRDHYVAMRDGRVMWDAPDMQGIIRREKESGLDWRSVPELVMRCVPEDEEPEAFGWYRRDAEQGQSAPH